MVDPIRQLVQRALQGRAPRLTLRVVRVARDPDRFAPEKDAACERVRNEEPVPRRQDFFFDDPKVTGKIGRPVALARWMTPG